MKVSLRLGIRPANGIWCGSLGPGSIWSRLLRIMLCNRGRQIVWEQNLTNNRSSQRG